jgi:sigma-B regulation protein RsbU (phosphoserine phosphatase)
LIFFKAVLRTRMHLSQDIGLTPAQLMEVFPFHIAVDASLRILRTGAAVDRVCSGISSGTRLDAAFTLAEPAGPMSFATLTAATNTPVILESRESRMRLKCHVVKLDEPEGVLLLGAPLLLRPEDAARCGLSSADYSRFDASSDYFAQLAAQEGALEGLRTTNQKLTAQRAQLRKTNRQLSTQFKVTRALAESATLAEAAPKMLKAFCDGIDWEWGCLWRPDRRRNAITAAGIWHQPGMELKELSDLTSTHVVQHGTGLIGRVWNDARPIWIDGMENMPNDPRVEVLKRAGIASVFAFPVFSGTEVTGVIEFFSRDHRQSDEELEGMLGVLGNQIGQSIEHKLVDEILRESREKYRILFDSNPQPMWVYDSDTLGFLAVNDTAVRKYGYSRQEFMGMSILDIRPAEERAAVESSARALQSSPHNSGPWTHETKDGHQFSVEIASHALEYNGRAGRIVCASDITERLRAERLLSEAREREIDIGSRIQETLLIRKPPERFPGLQIAARSLASQRIDGDYCDFFVFEQSRMDVAVADVMGKGVPAALIAAAGKAQFQRAVPRLILSLEKFGRLPEPEEIVMATHRALTAELVRLESFLTLCYASFNVDSHTVTMVDCGHPRTVHYRAATGDYALLQGHNLPLGFSEKEVYSQFTVPMQPGDVFVMYSDGVTEARSPDEEFFGEERLAATVANGASLDPETLITSIYDAIREFTGCQAVSDDLTCVAVKIEEFSGEMTVQTNSIELRSDLTELETARAFVSGFCNEQVTPPLPEERVDALQLAVDEAVVNVISHAYSGRDDQRIQIEASSGSSGTIAIRLLDWGLPFDPSDVPMPSFDGSREHGFGHYIIHQCVDKVDYYQDELGRNCMVLTIYRDAEPKGIEIEYQDGESG